MTDHSEISRLVASVFQAWQQAGIHFLILRNYEGLPDFNTNDIDVLVEQHQLPQAERVLVSAAKSAGFRLHNRAEFATLALYFSHPDSGAQAHFDLFTALKWRGFDFLSCDEFLAKKIPKGSFSIPSPSHEAATNLMASFIFSGRVKEKYRAGIAAAFRTEPDAARELLAMSYGQKLADALVTLAAEGKWGSVETLIGPLRRALIARQIARQPLRTLCSLLSDFVRLTKRFFHPPGLVIVLCGPDGCGKSTVAPKIIESLQPTFSPEKGRRIHWKPRVFSKWRDTGTPVTDPHGKPPRSRFVSLAYFAFHWLEYFLGWPLRIFPVTFKGGLVMIDRYYYDFFTDQRRYRLQVPQAVVRCGYALLPKPDLIFLLDAPPEILQARKQEVPFAETARQRAAYLELVKNFKNSQIIDATQSPEKVAADVQKIALNFLAARMDKRNGN